MDKAFMSFNTGSTQYLAKLVSENLLKNALTFLFMTEQNVFQCANIT